METKALSSSPSPAAHHHQWLVEWNDTQGDFPCHRLIPELFQEWVERTPDAPALEFGDQKLSYQELGRQADQLARRLRTLGVGRETLVATCMGPSATRIVALVGILKAGGVYVPMEPADPTARLTTLLEDSAAALVLTDSENRDRAELLARRVKAGERPAPQVVVVDETGPADEGLPSQPPIGAPVTSSDQLAYVLYTSGSTGRPKGVGVSHRAVIRLVRATDYIRIEPCERFSQVANIAFDAATFEIWGALLNGAALVGIPKLVILSPTALIREMEARRVSTMLLTTAVFNQIVRTAPEAFRGLRHLLFGGEASDPRRVRELLAERSPERRFSGELLHIYGPTECTTFASWQRVLEVPEGSVTVPIGRPIAHTTLYVLDPKLRPVPPGEPGELCVGREGLARGYLNRPGLSAERFVPDPFAESAAPGGRLYRTGDLVHMAPDGAIDFLGRTDHQVKLRGIRMELGEVEAVLGSHPGVAEAVVMIREDRPGDPELVAYAVPRAGDAQSPVEAGELRRFLGERLPEIMVPTSFVFLDQLPLTPNGKVDRKALPAPESEAEAPHPGYAAPRNPLEETLAGMVRELLGRVWVGADDDLMELGGHSLLLAQLVTRIRQILELDLPLPAVFEAPTIAAIAERLEGLREAPAPLPVPPLRRAGRDRELPLSFAQERVWFLSQLAPGSIAYNVQLTLRFRGPLELRLLERTFSEIVRRHEILRTTFPGVEGRPIQVIHPPFAVRIPLIDLQGIAESEREAECERRIAEALKQPFVLTRLPLVRWILLKLSDERHALLQIEHHFVHDGWSIALILSEMKAIYPALAAGRPVPLPELPIQYADFAIWQREWMRGEALEQQLAYWKERLGGSPPVLELPTDRPRPEAHSFRGDALQPVLPAELYASLRSFSRREGVSLFITTLAAFNTLLYRTSGQRDVVLGSGLANRRLRELETMIGMVVNTVVLRIELAPRASFRELLAQSRKRMMETHVYQDVPFETLVAELRPERHLDHNPLFQVMFSFHDSPVPDLDFAGLEAELRYLHNRSAKAMLNVVGIPRAEQRLGRGFDAAAREEMRFIWEFSSDLFDRTTVERMERHYQTLLRGAVADPARSLGELPLLDVGERQQLLWEWNDTHAPPERARPMWVHELFEARAAAAPDAVAVVSAGARLSYGELNRRANRLAHDLRARGLGPERCAGLGLERSPELVEGILAVLKAGGAYLPIDPASPPERLEYVLDDAGVALLLTRVGLRARLGELACPVVCLDRRELDESREDNPGPRLRPENLAYVIYTSGSTGRPKGTELAHGGLVNLVDWHQRTYRVTPRDRATQLAGPGFDAAVWELWPYLAAGAAIHIPEPEVVAAPARLPEWLADEAITLCFMPTPLAEAVLNEPIPARLRLRALLTGGDRLHRYPDPGLPFALVNHYGPTENTVVTTWTPVAAEGRRGESPPIGRPLPNHRLYLLDAGLRPVPIGVVGELMIAGDGLARGYRQRPQLTAEQFVPDPFSVGGRRLYRTGDLVRALPDGELAFLGRRDHQVKLRGFRIELGEIEATLGRHPAVREVAVLVRGAADSSPQTAHLVAYVAFGEESAADELREFLLRTLPEYMVPSAFVELEALPWTTSGKVDRAALPAPGEGALEPADRWVAPRTPTEEALAEIWAEVLGDEDNRPKIGVHDSFFVLGGHSLLATRVVSRIRNAFAVELPLAALFEAPTVAGMAARVQEQMRAGALAGPPIERVPRNDVPLSFAQERLWFLDLLAPDSPVYNIPMGYQIEGPLRLRALAGALRAVAARHESLRTTIAEGPRQEIAAEARAELPVVDLRALPAEVRSLLAAALADEEAWRPFDLATGPLLRATLLRLDDEGHRLLLTLHHIISDGWSMELLAAELGTLYQALAAGRPARGVLPELEIQYPDFAAWQRRWLRGAVLEEQLAYWRGKLAGAATVLELPTDRPRPPRQSFRGTVISRPLPPGLAEPLKRLGHERGATLFMTGLAAFFTLLHRTSGQRDAVVGTPIANRGRREIEGLIGFFVNTLVLRGELDEDPDFVELLGRVRETALGAFAHQDLPFERLVEELQPRRDLSRTPLFQVMFLVRRADEGELAPGLAMRALPADSRTAKFDMTFHLVEESGALVAAARYSTDLFDRTTMARFLGHFERLLGAIAEAPERRISELPMLAVAERQALLREWNDTATGEGPGRSAHELVEARIARRPEAVAVADRHGVVTYGELGRRAERLAGELRRRGVGPEVIVALVMERSVELVVGMLGVLKAGGAYLPLDPGYPAAHLRLMLGDSRCPVVVTPEGLVAIGNGNGIGIGNGGEPEQLAYVIYTSGSTGTPKGVEVRHGGLSNLVRWYRRLNAFTPGDRASQVAGPAFDGSVKEFWPILAAGGSLHIPDDEIRSSPAELLAWLAAKAIDVCYLPTPLAEAVLGEPWPEGMALRTLLCGGDRLRQRPRGDLPCAVVNLYGPTENTVVTTAGTVRPQAPRLPSIGRPIPDTAVYVVDRHLRPVPVGVIGELVTRGRGLARGYGRRPQRTAERFVPDPQAAHAGGRLYRTGDLVRWRVDGRLEFVGRIDHQVKVRGFRIELGEVEAALRRHPAVREAVAVLRDEMLAAYVVSEDAEPDAAELRRHVAASLPEHMVPAVVVGLDALPLTANGKVDRRALPAPERTAGAGAWVAPRDPFEELVAGIWAEVLGFAPGGNRVGAHDDFFDLGGHSLLATQVQSRLRRELGVELPLRTLFEQPAVAGLAASVAAARRRDEPLEVRPIRRRQRPPHQALPMSFAQQRLWFFDRFEPGSTLYNIPILLHLRGEVDPGALARALHEIVRRHEVLRTTFAMVEAEPVQRIHPVPEPALPIVELGGLPEPRRRTESQRLAREEARQPFDLDRGPLLRLVLLAWGPEEHVLLFTVHHIVFDGWSHGIFMRELAAGYQAFSSGARIGLPELPVQYADFAVWQRRWLAEGPVPESQLAYWRDELAGLPMLELPADRPRPAVQSFRGTVQGFRLPAGLGPELAELSRRRGATLFMTLLAAFQTLLGRTAGQDEPAVGSPVANRNRAEIEGLVGFFVNTLVLRAGLAGDPPFVDFLARIRETALGAFAHQDLPFERLVEALDPERQLSQNPLVQVVFVLQNAPLAIPELAPGLTVEATGTAAGTAKFDLTLLVTEDEAALRGKVEYNTDLYDATTIRRLTRHLETLLAGIVADPERRLSELPLLPPAERCQLLAEWNDVGAAYPASASIPELFEARVEAAPEAVAVVAGEASDGQLSYRELNRRANRLAHRLRAEGVGPEVCVGLGIERSPEMLVAILGILKAGGAYVPLDPSYPRERLAFMLADAAVRVLLVEERSAERFALPEDSPCRLLRPDRDAPAFSRCSPENPRPATTAENLAYVMYTSGSTGRPKGVSVVHRGVVRLVRGASFAELDEGQVFLQLAPISFDASTLEIWAPLLNGGRLVVFPPHTPSLQELGTVLERCAVTTLWLTAGLFHQLVAERPAGLGAVRQLLAGGDVLSPAQVRRALAGLPGCRVINGYGPTENTTFTCCLPMRRTDEVADPVSIGRPISGTRVHVLDRRLRPVGIGIPGELLAGGDGLARGYLKRPRRTAASFVPSPLGEPGARLYRTGDLVRYLGDGRIDFLGRRDFQVKLRGFRIELGEIEAILGSHPRVRAAAVVVREDRSGVGRQLVAYVVQDKPEASPGVARANDTNVAAYEQASIPSPQASDGKKFALACPGRQQGQGASAAEDHGISIHHQPPAELPQTLPLPPSGGELRAFLKERLPDYMVPSAFVTLESLPLTPSGKVDRRALPAPDAGAAAADYVAPRSAVEEELARIWARWLGLARVGAHGHFFELGGHSLLATQVISEIRDVFGVDLPLRRMFEGPTLAELAAAITEEQSAEPLRTRIRPRPRDAGPLPLSFSQLRQWLLAELEPGTADFNIPGGVRLLGPLDPAALARSIREIVDRHEALRTTFRPQDGEPVQVIAPPAEVPLPLVDLSAVDAADRRARRLAAEEANRPFDLARGPLLRVSLLRLAADEHVLLYTMHHAVSDGWSMGIFFRELGALYPASRSALPRLPIQYADFALWQRRRLQGEFLERLASYWRERLAGAPPMLELPTDRPRPMIQDMRGASRRRPLPARLTRALESLSRRHGASLFMVLMAVFKVLLYRTTGQRDLSVGTFIANRTRSEIADLIGFFVNTLVLRTDLGGYGQPGHPTSQELLARERETTLGAYEHQDLPFETLLEILQPERSTSHTPLFQVMLVLQNMPRRELELPELKLDYLQPETHRANFDLALWVMEEAGSHTAVLSYPPALFDASTARRLLGHYETLLEAFAAAPATAISELPLLSAPESHQLLAEWTATAVPFSGEACIHQLFEAQAEAMPDAPAVVCGRTVLSYRELDARATALAHHLRELGVAAGPPETVVAIAAERVPEVVVGLLGILKAGGVYLPLDPSYPEDRLAFLLDDAGARVLLVQEATAGRLPGPEKHRARVVVLDGPQAPAAAREPTRSPKYPIDPDQLAYVIYTSGTTGVPKGVAVSHRQVLPVLSWFVHYFALDHDTRVLQNLSPCFDFGVFELLTTLVAGGSLCLLPAAEQGELARYLDAIEQHDLNTVHTTPPFFRELTALAAQSGRRLSGVEIVHLGGEAVDRDLVREIARIVEPECRLYNGYGPTETSINSTIFRIEGQSPDRAAVVPIGRATANSSVIVLDRRGLAVPLGVPGELLIGGLGVSRGYLNRPALTAERFVPDPFADHAGRRLYRSGDLVRWLPDGGFLEFRGRIDHQVKIRGLRIEPGEIEAVLAAHPAVRHAVVVARELGGGHRLVAYLVTRSEAPAVGELHAFLRERLPDYMVPASVVVLDALPLTPTGKVDRRALPAPSSSRPELADAYTAPRNPIEEVLAGIWAELLGLERVGVADNFFELGGHSLLVAQFAARVRQSFAVELPLGEIFNRPTVAAIAGFVDAAEQARHELEIPPIRPAVRDGEIPLSFPQERIWFLEQLTPGNLAYNFQVLLHFRGALDVAALDDALSEIVRRHEIYCTTFPAVGGRPVQRLHPPWRVKVPVIDLRALPAGERRETTAELVHAATQSAFDVRRLPLLRWTLLRLDDEVWRLVQVEHHFVHDGWSLAIFLGELQELYSAFHLGRPSPLPELPLQFADFTIWQRHWIRDEVMERLLSYWKQKLAGLPPYLDLPTDRPHPRRNRMRGTAFQVTPSRELLRGLRGLGRRQGFTLYMSMLAAFYALLHRYSGQTELAVGAGVANRRLREIEQLIGMIVNTLVLRTDASGNPSFWELLARVRETTLEAYAHQDMPFERLVGELRPERNPSRNPLFQVLFAFHDSPMPYPNFAGLHTEFEGLHNRSAKTEMNVVVVPQGEQHAGMKKTSEEEEPLGIIWEYNTDLYDATTARRMGRHYLIVLERMVADPEMRIGELDLLGASERHQLLVEWNATTTAYPRQDSIHRLFEARVAAAPEAVAIVFDDQVLSYRELNRRANRLAHHLRALGVGPDVLAGVCLERSPHLVVAILAILKAGGAYLPLDLSYPAQRLALMLEDAAAPVIVTAERPAATLPAIVGPGVEIVRLDRDAAASDRNPQAETTAENLAYVVYTSGSTGMPKGVSVCHRSVVRLVCSNDFAAFGPEEVFLQFAPISFDASTLELWGPLLNGGRLVIAPPGMLSLAELAATIARYRVTTLWLTAGLFHRIADAEELRQLAGVRQLLAGGDVVSVAHVRRTLEALPACTLINGYGPTENTTFTCCHSLTGPGEVGTAPGTTVAIGRPIANTRIAVLDPRLQPVPVGVPGELYAAGDGLARGYLHRPDLTAELLVPHPAAGERGERLYRTGDLVRYRPDGGQLEFLGRTDFQVKVRGFRIELTEIEVVLGRHPAVGECALLAREDVPGDKRLVAYVVPATAAEAADRSAELGAFLKQKLPEYMVPAAFVFLGSLPLTANGKLDRSALPAPDYARPEDACTAPRTPLEEALVSIWSEVLGVARVGVEADFFELGGHSLLATQVVSRVLHLYRVQVPLEDFFAAATPAGLAAVIERLQAQGERPGATAAAIVRAEPQAVDRLLARAETMPDEDLDALLESMLPPPAESED